MEPRGPGCSLIPSCRQYAKIHQIPYFSGFGFFIGTMIRLLLRSGLRNTNTYLGRTGDVNGKGYLVYVISVFFTLPRTMCWDFSLSYRSSSFSLAFFPHPSHGFSHGLFSLWQLKLNSFVTDTLYWLIKPRNLLYVLEKYVWLTIFLGTCGSFFPPIFKRTWVWG